MDRLRRRNDDIEKQLSDMTMPSDNTQVVSPYRVVANNTIRRNREVDDQYVIRKVQEERRRREEEESKSLAIRDERRRIEDRERAYKKKQRELQKQYEEQQTAAKKQAEEEERLKNESYEKDYQYWLNDVTKNPDKYSSSTQDVVKRAMHSYKHPNDYLARLDRGIARTLFGLKNRAGSVALNSIDTNGTRYLGEISLREHEADALKEHLNRLDKQSKIQDFLILQQNYQPGSQEYNDAQRNIDNLNALLNDPLSIQLDEDYKQTYTINKSGWWDLLKKAYRNYVSSEFTYDQYKDYITKRNRQQDVDLYYNALVLSRNDAQKNTSGSDFLYSKINMGLVNRTPKPSNVRTLQSYTPEELFELDVQKTRERSSEIKDELDAYQKLYKENREHYFDSMKYWEVSEYFKHGVNAHQNDPLYSLGYWGYSVYPMIGSTASSPEQAASTVLNLASMGGFASSPWTGGAGSAVGAVAGVAGGYYGLQSGYAENKTEAGQRRIDRFKELLSLPQTNKLDKTVSELKDRSKQYWKHQGKDDKWINEYLDGEEGTNRAINDYFTGLTKRLVDENGEGYIKHPSGTYMYTNPIADKDVDNAELYSTQGLEALYDADNARTLVGNLFQTLVSLTPTGTLRKAASVQINKAANKVFARSAAKSAEEEVAENVAKNTYKNGFRRKSAAKAIFDSASRGAAIGEMAGFGVVGEVIGGAAGVGVGAAKLGLEALPTSVKNLYRSVEEGVLHKYQKVYDKLLPNSKLGKAIAIYGGRAAKTTLASSMSEAAEEAVQYLNSKEDYASKYGWNGMSLADALINDVYQGARVFNSYGALLGITNSELLNDTEYWANLKGGFALGGLHTGVMRVGIEGVNAYREIPTHEAIINSAVMNRELDKKDRAANVEFARQAMRKRTNETLSVLDWMEKNESRREQPFFTQEDYDEKRRAVNRIGQLVNDKNLRGKLEAKGIVYGTEEYANAIADRYGLEAQAAQNQREAREKQININAFYNSKEYQQEADDIIEQELSNSFEATMGRQAAIVKAGNEAVAEEIKRANAAGEDTKSSDFKRHLLNVRKDAQEQASRSINLDYRNKLLGLSHTANKLKSLLKLKQLHKNISEFFKFLSSKFNLNPRRADAKLIYKNVEEQVNDLKRQLAEVNEDFNENLSDEAIIEYIENLTRVKSHEEEIEANEIAAAMLQADAAVINQHLGMLDFGLMRDNNGNWTYNPTAYKQHNTWQKGLAKQLESGEITLEQYLALQKEPPQFASYNKDDVKDNPYKKRIQAIMDARKDDKALEDMANDIENGDGVVKILDELAKQEESSNNSEEIRQQALQESNTLTIDDESRTAEQPTEQPLVSVTPEQKYEERKKASKSRYEKRKKNLRDLRKNLRNRANAAIVPIPTPLLDLANILIHKAELGTYKIAEFAEQISQIAKNRGLNAKSFISGIKAFYIDNLVQMSSINPDLMDNFSTVEEIQKFSFGDDIKIKQPVTVGTAQEMQDLINSDLQYVDKTVSTHYDTIVKRGDTVEVYPNREAIVNARFGEQHATWKWVVDTLTAANTSEESFRNALTEIARGYEDFPIEQYVSYRNVPGIIQAIANRRSNTEEEESIQNGKRIRNAVVAILLGNEEEIDTTYFLGDYQAFRNQVLEFKEKITSKDNGMGLTILDTTDLIYGTDPYGNNISSEADIIATNGDKIYAIDVRYSFDSIRQNWHIKYPKATFSIGEHVTRRLKQIEQIINSKFGRGVNGLYCFPVVYNPSDKVFYVEQYKDSFIIPVRPDTADVVTSSLDELKQSVQSMVDEINKLIDEYNSFVYEAILYTDKYLAIDNISSVSFDTEQEYVDYINLLHAKYDTLGDRIDEIRTFIQEYYNTYTDAWNLSIAPAQSQNDTPGQELLDVLHDRCSQLDILMDKIPSLKVTTEAEKQDIKNVVNLIFDAQKALDDVLQDKRLYAMDFTREEELIASALELMAENKENFGEISTFVRNWWVTNFAVGPSGNNLISVKTESDVFFGYINKIQSWTDTLRNHVLSDLENNIPLQEWYSSVLNKYFSELLNNAEQFANNTLTDLAQKAAIQRSVAQGREIIENFNSLYDTRPEEDIDAPVKSPADVINRMPTKWKDKYSWTTSVMPSLDQMRSPIYYYLSTSPSFLDSKFILSTDKNGKLQLYIEGVSRDGSKRNITLSFENDLSKASQKDIDRWQYINLARQRFIRKALAALKFVKEHPNYEIKFDKSTNKGEIRYNDTGELSPVSKFLFATKGNQHDLYNVKLSSLDRIGTLVVLNNKETGQKIYNVKSGDYLLDDIGGFDRDYQKQQLHTQSGALVYFYDTGNGQYIGTPIQSAAIGQDAPKLVYLIERYISGDRTDLYGFDILDLLRMRLYMADPDRKISPWNNTNSLVQIQGSVVTIGKDRYDIVSQKQALIDRISNMQNVTNHRMLNEFMGTSQNSILHRLSTLFDSGEYEKLQLTNGLVFDKEDFIHEGKGSTWLGYMLRNGMLGSSATSLGYKELRLDNIRVILKGSEEQKTVPQEIKQAEKQKVVVRGDDFFDKLAKLGGATKVIDYQEIDANRGVEEQESFMNSVIDYFNSVLGENGKVEFAPADRKFLGAISRNERIAGICTSEMIKLSRYVPFSVAWHEAFHKIFELVIPAEERDSFYKAYRNSIYGILSRPTDRDIAEAFADMFMTYMQNKQAIDKADSFFKKIKPWIKSFLFNIGMTFKIGRSKAREMYSLYNKINKGEYKNSIITEEQNKRFKKLFGDGLYYTVTNTDSKVSANFSNLADIGDRDKLVRGLAYYILKSYEIDSTHPNVAKVRITGGTSTMESTLERLETMYDGAIATYMKSVHPVFEEVFESVEKEFKTKDGKVVKRKYYPKFEAISRHVADYISSLFDTMRKPKIEEDDSDGTSENQNDNGEAIDFMASDTDHWDKAAYEFSKLSGLMDEVKVFFGTIPYSRYVDEKQPDGTVQRTTQIDYTRNKFGCPEFMPIEEVWGLVVNNCMEATTIEELDKMLEELSSRKEVYAEVYKKYHNLIKDIYKKNEDGKVIVAQTNFDKEAQALQILGAIQSQKMKFLVALSSKQKNAQVEGKSIRIVESSMERDSRSYPDQWTRYLVSGQIGVFQRERGEGLQVDAQGKRKKTVLLFREGMGGKNGTDIFSRTAKFFEDIRTSLLSNSDDIEVDGVKYNTTVLDDASRLKDEIINRLNTIGIMMERDALDYMLSELYGGVEFDALRRFVNNSPVSNDPKIAESESKSTLQGFINQINRYVSDGGVINQPLLEGLNAGYGQIGFVNKLANWLGKYKRTSSQNMAYALNGKKLYSISQNSTISHIIKNLNTFDDENETVKVLSGFDYNIHRSSNGRTIGSIILKHIANKEALHIEGFTYIGFKTDNKGDQGSEYVEESTVEDYMAKLSMLQQGYLIFPALADKGTYMVMNGIPIPGMQFRTVTTNESGFEQEVTSVQGAPMLKAFGGHAYLVPNDNVLDQMIEYAKCELLGIQECMEDLGYEEIPGYEKQGRTPLTEEQKILNYHTKNKKVEPNGTRFLSLTKVACHEFDKESGKWKVKTYNLNDPRMSSVDALKLANEKFFARREGETVEQMVARQRETMALTLAIQTRHEVETASNLGIVFKNGTINSILLNRDTKDLNESQIEALTSHFMRTSNYKNTQIKWNKIEDSTERARYAKMARSLAISAILQDATIRHIISSQEIQRCFSGHPALFKVKYGETSIIDSAYDIQKRIGGMVSTGEDNITELPGIQREYTCAECNDYEVGSSANILSRLPQMFGESNVRYILGNIYGNWKDIYKMSIDQLKERYPFKSLEIDEWMNKGLSFAKSFDSGINVADGASYITADMCRDMLRMRGAYNNRVRKAFKILMSSSKYDWVKSAEAYKTVYEALNIVPTKYTAYGFRPHTSNGNQVSNVAVAYYNKFALFPIFPCMATGKMYNIYQKMLDEKVDMLLMTSAVKVGSQGAVSFDGTNFTGPFNTYKQSYSYLRRQLNTDPEEKDESAIGTQMMKIGLANLVLDREYKDLDGNVVSGQKVYDDLMSSVNSLAQIGEEEIEDMFMDTNEEKDNEGNIISSTKSINYQKVSDYLKEQLTLRNANKTLIQAIQYDPTTKKLVCPLAATTDAAWIESIFISTMNKHVVDITTPGKSFIQRSVFGIEGKTGEGLIKGDEGMAADINNGQKLQMINEEGSMDCVISIDYFRDIIPEGLSFDQAKQWLIDQGIISGFRINDEDMSQEWHNAEAAIIGYRIPTQAQSSIHALRVVDVLPATKTTIILPEEFTKITGSDFDIDHLYLASFNFRKDENGNMTRHYEVGEKRYYQNKILESLITLLKDTENSLNSLYKPIDNDTELVTAVSDYIPETGSTKEDPYNFGTLHEQVIRKNDYITGKKGIAPFALNSTSHMLGRLSRIKFRESKLVQATRLLYFDNALDKDYNTISAWLSGFINAHVDIVKDPYISRLNVNPFTYNMLNLMIRCGWGDTALWFLANPVIRAMAAANDLANSQYMKRPASNKSGKSYREDLILKSLSEYLNEDDISDAALERLLTSKNASEERIYTINWLDRNQDKLKLAAISGEVDHDTALKVFYAWKILEKYSLGLSGLVQHTKVDTRKYGKNFIAVQKYKQEYDEIFNPADPKTAIWDLSSLQRLARETWIGSKTNAVARLPKTIFGGLTFNANERFVNAVLKFAKHLEYDGRTLYQDDVVNLSKHLQTAIKSKWFAGYAREVLKMTDKDIAGLFTGNTSMNRRLVSLKDLIAHNENYKRLATNPFLNQIYSMLEDKPVFANGREMADRPGFVTVLDNVDDSKLNSDLLSEGWLDLMNDENPYISKFARQFAVYAFFSSGDFKGWNKMLKYLPFEFISGEVDPQFQSYANFIDGELQHVSDDYSDLFDEIVANNFMDYRFAKQTELVNDDNTRNFLNNDRGVRIGMGVTSQQKEDVANYISVKKPGMRSGHQDSYEVYTKIAMIPYNGKYYPVYAKIKKRGYHTRGNDIYEYNWDFNYAENENKGSDTFDYEGAISRVREYVQNGELDGFTDANIRAINKVYIAAEPNPLTAPKSPKVEEGAHVATRGYKKGDPLKHPNFNYVFTENAQAYLRSQLVNSDEESKRFTAPGVESKKDSDLPSSVFTKVNPTAYIKLNVSDVNGTNQAGIRTDEKGNLTLNAYGIIVKKNLQDVQGKFVSQEGTFLDTEEDFELFTKLNSHMFDRLENSSNKVIVFPLLMALGKAALPKRFAEWLQDQLLDRFGIVSEVTKNERSDYEGYGLNILRVEPKESNLRQDRDYDWKYEEDSGYSGVLEELGLSEKVRMNGGMTYRPHYEFGRIYLTDNERLYIEERLSFAIEGEQYSQDDINTLEALRQSGKLDINSYGKNNPNQKLVEYPDELHDVIKNLKWFVYDYDILYDHNYIAEGTVSERVIKMAEALKLYEKLLDLLTKVGENINLDSWGIDSRLNFIDMLYEYMENIKEDVGEFDELYNIEYSYTDKRQQELFSDEDFELTEEEQEEAKRYKKACEGE